MAAAVAGAGMRLPAAHADQPQLIKASTAPIFAPPPGAPMSFADIFDRVSPAVVSINVTSRVSPDALRRVLPFLAPDQSPDDEDQDDNSAPGGGRTQRGQPRLPSQQSSGSGFFISADGYIVTNNHVVENAESIKVVLKDEREFDATVVGRDEGTDLAVIKVKANGPFPFVNFENSAKPRVGDWVIAVGNPFGLGGTATAGIISAYGRDIGENFVDYIQIDAPINRGNSGGPTFDVFGRVIGVNTAIFSPSGGSVGIGFAIPADVADQVTKELIGGRQIQRGYIGATIQTFTTRMAEAMGAPGQRGAIVNDVVQGGPAQKGGLLPGDIITSVNGASVTSNTETTRAIARIKPGETARLQVIRDGQRRVVEFRTGSRPPESQLALNDNTPGSVRPGSPGGAEPQSPPVLGMHLAPLDGALRQRYGLSSGVTGVVITSVDNNSTASDLGLQRGDVLVRVGEKAVTSPADVAAAAKAAQAAGRESLLLGVSRAGRLSFVTLDLAK
jgi:serine protease Do